ncbi:hypothetical protein CCP3SC15_2270006 [Gammaproteobacteria bacterium]
MNNVLNVIKEPQNRDKVIAQAADAIKPEGKAYFLIYEGDRKGNPKDTSKGHQQNRPAASYITEIQAHFGKVTQKGSMLVAEQPIKSKSAGIWEGFETRFFILRWNSGSK